MLSRHLESVTILLEKGADPNARDVEGNTPLYAAAFVHEAEIADLLVRSYVLSCSVETLK